MQHRRFEILLAVLGLLVVSPGLAVAQPEDPTGSANGNAASSGAANSMTVQAARERAQLLHDVYSATLDVMHHRYFHRDRATVPARALEDVFAEIDRKARIKSSWIAVSGRAMSIDHEPKGEFELAAMKAIRGGQESYEVVDESTFRRVGAIRLSGGCLNCHGRFGSTSTAKQFAGLVIEVPLEKN